MFYGGMSDAMGSIIWGKTFSTEFFDWRISSKKSRGFRLDPSASRNSQSKKFESTKPFFDCMRKLVSGLCQKRPFSTDKSDCLRNGPSSPHFDVLSYRSRVDLTKLPSQCSAS